MINIIKTKLVNKTENTLIYRLGNSNIVLKPGMDTTICGDLFSMDTKQEGTTENILVAAYNGDLDIIVIVDKDFAKVVQEEGVVNLPARSKVLLKTKDVLKVEPVNEDVKPVVKVEPVNEDVKPVAKTEVKVEGSKEVKKVEAKEDVKPAAKTEVKVEGSKEVKKVEAKEDVKPVAKEEAKTEAKTVKTKKAEAPVSLEETELTDTKAKK
jgi:hypothetical protein